MQPVFLLSIPANRFMRSEQFRAAGKLDGVHTVFSGRYGEAIHSFTRLMHAYGGVRAFVAHQLLAMLGEELPMLQKWKSFRINP